MAAGARGPPPSARPRPPQPAPARPPACGSAPAPLALSPPLPPVSPLPPGRLRLQLLLSGAHTLKVHLQG